jgi:hypothetical protein
MLALEVFLMELSSGVSLDVEAWNLALHPRYFVAFGSGADSSSCAGRGPVCRGIPVLNWR